MMRTSGTPLTLSDWNITLPDQRGFNALDREKRIELFARLGHLAPSTHNTQPWRFRIDAAGSALSVYLDRAFVLPASDGVGRQAVISVGCAMENIVTSAVEYGMTTRAEFIPVNLRDVRTVSASQTGKKLVQLARIYFTISGGNTPKFGRALTMAMRTRRIMRAEFDQRKKIPPRIAEELERIPDGKVTQLHIVTDPVRRFGIAEFQAQADGYVIHSKKFARELGEWLLPNDSVSGLGMPGVGFGLKDAQAIRLHQGLRTGNLEPEDGLRFALAGKSGIEQSPLLAFLTVARDDSMHWLQAGMDFERMFLTLERSGISVAVHAGMVEVALINRIFAATIGTTRKLAVLFRAGYVRDRANLSRPHSPRRPFSEVLV